jgi:predicted membrane-bound dolichyl-phosphate-mannose-protein mannosyltransferase
MPRVPVGRRGVVMIDSIRRLDPGALLTTILVLGLFLRVFIAAGLLPQSGFSIDTGDFTAWAQRMASVGPEHFYEEGYFADYPPGYLYVLWLLGTVGGWLAPLAGHDVTSGIVKVPGILADVAVAWLLFVIARRWGPQLLGGRWAALTGERLGIAAATIYVFNPGTIFNSAVWGQIDSVGTLVLLATIYALARGWTEAAALGAVVALLVKFQFAFLVPVVAAVGLKRHLWGRSSDPSLARRDPLRVLTSLAVGVVGLTVLMLPFGMVLYAPLAGGDPRGLLGILPEPDPTRSLIGKFVEAAGTYTGLSVNAFSMWRNPWSGLGDTLHWGDDTGAVLSLAGFELTWQFVGTLLFAVAAALAIWIAVRRDDLRGILLAALVLAIAFFVLPTRVHERYLFPALALAAPLVFSGRAWPWLYGGLSLVFFANVYWVYTADWSFAGRIITPGRDGLPMERDPLLAATLLTDWGIWLLSGLGLALLLAVGWLAVRAARERPTVTEAHEPPHDLPASAPAAMGQPAPEPTGGGGPSWLRRNPADAYLREPWRRLDRRDAILLLALVAFALVFRLWRLDVPRGYHFDEVYHARSAAEFLGSWRHGWDRDVYEWTHPMLAKYLIAGGIVLADPNAVVGTHPLDGPASALAVAPRRAADGRDRSIVFTVSPPGTVVAADAERGDEIARWGVGGQVASLGYDPEGLRLLVGRADRGRVDTYELAGLLASPDGRAPPSGSPIESDLESVIGIVMPRSDGAPILLRGPDGVVAVDAATDEIVGRVDGRYAGAGYVLASGEEPALVALSLSDRDELLFVDAETMSESSRVRLDVPLLGPFVLRGDGEDQQLFALTGPLPASDGHDGTEGGVAVLDADGRDGRCPDEPCLVGLAPLPGAGTTLAVHQPTSVIVVAGTVADGSAELWTLTRHFERRGDGTIGLAVFDSTSLPGTPLAMAYDAATTAQGDDRARLFIASADAAGEARLVEVDAGANGFAWRLAGVIAGSLLVGLVYLLAATMFSRRRIAVLAAAFVAVDGMSYAMGRIAMNDMFVALFIVAAYLVFWQVWSGRWRRSAWWALPLTGVLIGLAAASKWVGFYALAGLLVLVLARSDLGRLLLVVLVGLAAVIGGVGAPWPFTLIMIGLLGVALAIGWARPIRIDAAEALSALPATAVVLTGTALAFVLAYGAVDASDPSGPIEYVFSLLARGAEAGWPAWLMIGVAAALIAWRAIRSLRDPASDARWYRPGEMGGFAWSWVGACLVVVPLVVYGLTYLPYLALGHEWATPGGPGYGWSVDQLHRQMYGYHFSLTAGHASASPWWSWPLALKPVWFFNGTYDGDRIAVIYNSGNPLLFWAGVPALAACAILAWKRRSAALVLLVAAFAFQYVPWIRIERATFAYHYLTAVIFAMVAVAYVVDELLRRPAWRQLAIGYLALAAVAGVIIFPLGAALPMPDWYINAARALPPWNYAFQFPDPPSGDRGELIATGALTALLGVIVAVAAAWLAVYGRPMWERRRRASVPQDPAWPTATTGPESG